MSKVEGIKFKALNPDDDSEVSQVVELFRRSHGESFPLAPVYDRKFWKIHAGVRFTSLVAMHERQMVAHLAIRPDRDDPSHVQIYLPLCDLELISLSQQIHGEMLSIIERQGQRQGWRMLYSLVVEDMPQMHAFANQVLQGKEVAIWPQCLPPKPGHDDQMRRHVMVMQRMLQQNPQHTTGESPDFLFVPEAHQAICEWLYNSLGLTRVFLTHSQAHAGGRLPSSHRLSALSADRRAVETRTYRQTGVTLSCVEPGLLNCFTRVFDKFRTHSTQRHFVSVNMRDDKAPGFCEALEERGYSFCGVLPMHRGKESIIYASQRLEFLPERESALSTYVLGRYLENFDFCAVQAQASTQAAPTRGTTQLA